MDDQWYCAYLAQYLIHECVRRCHAAGAPFNISGIVARNTAVWRRATIRVSRTVRAWQSRPAYLLLHSEWIGAACRVPSMSAPGATAAGRFRPAMPATAKQAHSAGRWRIAALPPLMRRIRPRRNAISVPTALTYKRLFRSCQFSGQSEYAHASHLRRDRQQLPCLGQRAPAGRSRTLGSLLVMPPLQV